MYSVQSETLTAHCLIIWEINPLFKQLCFQVLSTHAHDLQHVDPSCVLHIKILINFNENYNISHEVTLLYESKYHE